MKAIIYLPQQESKDNNNPDRLDVLVQNIIGVLDTPHDNWQVDEIKQLIAEYMNVPITS